MISIPFVTFPNTVCFPFSQGVDAVQMKNCDPLVFGPAFAIERVPNPEWAMSKSECIHTQKKENESDEICQRQIKACL